MISELAYDALVADLYAGATDPKRLAGFLRSLGAATDSHIITYLRSDHTSPELSTLMTVGAGPQEITTYSEHAGENLWFQRCLADIRPGAVFNGDAYVTHKELLASQYYDGFLRHIDTQHSVGICAAFEQNRGGFLTLCRSPKAGIYDSACEYLFQRLAPHVVNTVALQVQLEHLDAQTSQASLRQRGLFVLDAQWNWVGGNTVADDMVSTGWWRGRHRAPLEPVHAITRTAWRALQSSFDRGSRLQQVVPIHDRTGVLMAFASVHAYAAAAIGKYAPRYVLFVRPLHAANTEALSAQLRLLFGLTSAEAAFSLAMRTHGKSAAAAAALRITDATARVRLQTIFEKTGIHRQADLLLMLDALAETVV